MGSPLRIHFAVILGAASCAAAPERAVSVYAGRYTDGSLPEDIAFLQAVELEEATQVAVAYSEVFAAPSPKFRWEWEVNGVNWSGQQNHQEVAGLALFRWMSFPWDRYIDTSFAAGNGLSWATEIPKLEEAFHPDTGSTRLLYHIIIEFEFARPRTLHGGGIGTPEHWLDPWATFFRVHHRSGVFGTFDGVNGGSNVIALGLRYRW